MSNQDLDNTHPKPERQLNAKLVPFLTILFASLFALTGYRGWLAFFIGCGGAWLVSAIWIRIIERDLQIERKIDLAWAHVGESVPELLIITNNSKLPVVWLEIFDESEKPVEPVRLVTDIEPQITRRRFVNHSYKMRGIYSLGPTRLRTGDPLGIYTLTLHDKHVSKVLVIPPQLPLNQLIIPAGGLGDDKRLNLQFLRRHTSTAGVRDYMAGDSLKRIHWHTSAHRDTLMVRQLEPARAEDWWVIADLDASVQVGNGLYSTLELVIVLAASLITRGLKEHHRVGLLLAGPNLKWLEPRSGSTQRWNLLCALAAARPGVRPLADLITLRPPVRTGSLIIITPTCDPLWVASIEKFRHNGQVKVLLVNSGEFGVSADQRRVTALLSKRGISYSIIPEALLDEAYSLSKNINRKLNGGFETHKRYVEQGRSNWQNID